MKWIKSSAFLYLPVCLFFLVSGCRKDAEISTDALAYVPSDAALVTAFDLKSLSEKADPDTLKKMDFYRDASGEPTGRLLANMIFHSDASGIDPEKKMYLATIFDKNNPEAISTHLFFTLKNEEEFRRLFNEYADQIKEEAGVKILEFAPNILFSWNEHIAVLSSANDEDQHLSAQLPLLYAADPEKSMAANSGARKALGANHDFAGWLSFDHLAENPAAGLGLSLLGINPAVMKSNFIHFYGDFEQARINGQADFFINKELGENFIGRFFNHSIETDFSRSLQNNGLIFAAAVSLDPAGVNRFLKEHPQAGDFVNKFLESLVIQRQNLPEIFGGDLLIAAYNGPEDELPGLLVEANLADKKKARTYLDLASKQGRLYKNQAGEYETRLKTGAYPSEGMIGKIILLDNRLIFSSEEKLLEQIKTGNSGRNNYRQFKKDQAFVLVLDFEGLNAWTEQENEAFRSLELNINAEGADFTIKTKDNNSHSLHLFLQMLQDLSDIEPAAFRNRAF